MAFISGYKEIYKCKFCGEEVESSLLKNEYYHNNNGFVWVNNYPLPCEYNGKIVSEEVITKIKQPIIESFGMSGY